MMQKALALFLPGNNLFNSSELLKFFKKIMFNCQIKIIVFNTLKKNYQLSSTIECFCVFLLYSAKLKKSSKT